MMKLYCFGESGHAYKAALTLTLADVPWEPVFVDFFKGETRTPAFRAINPMGEVPVLVTEEATLTQSGVIQSYVAETTGKLTSDSPDEQREILRWLLWDAQKLTGQAGMTRFLMNFLPEEKRPQEVIAFQHGRLKTTYGILNDHLEGRDWIVGDAITIADCACCSYLYYPEPFGFDRSDWPNIDRWLNRIADTPGWQHPYDMMKRAFPG